MNVNPPDTDRSVVLRLVGNYGIAFVVAAALIWFPLTGFFLTPLTGGVLLSLICNLLLLHLGYLACTKRVPLAWLVVPIVCYGAWLGWLIWKTAGVNQEKSGLESENHFTEPIEKNMTLIFSANDKDDFVIRARRHLAPPVRVFMGPIELSPDKGQACTVRDCDKVLFPTPPTDPIVFHRLDTPDPTYAAHVYRYELTKHSGGAGDRVVGHFNFGALVAPIWAPLFVAGCYLIDDPSAWRCVMFPVVRHVLVDEQSDDNPYDPNHERSDPAAMTLANMLGVQYQDGAADQKR